MVPDERNRPVSQDIRQALAIGGRNELGQTTNQLVLSTRVTGAPGFAGGARQTRLKDRWDVVGGNRDGLTAGRRLQRIAIGNVRHTNGEPVRPASGGFRTQGFGGFAV